ncbi:MAG: SDR family oxidoreductase [Hyphomicrobium sp.]|nr:SDR family oxidoreductase [Hyphomicrobium sp.]
MAPIGLFNGQSALVTGSASNIGRAIAEALAAEGAKVLLADVDAERNAATLAAITAAGGKAGAIATDLSTPDGWRDLLDRIGNTPLDMFVHSACPPRKEVDDAATVSEATWDAFQNVNVRSGYFLGREIASTMQARGTKGRLLFITSLHAETPRNLPHYSAAKAGQTMVVRELARHFGPAGIRVNAIAPGAVPGGGFNAAAYDFSGKIALGRLGTAADLAGPALALLSDRFAGYVTGTTLVVDGGIDLFNWIKPPWG